MQKRLFILTLVLAVTIQIVACRYTVREIGFSTLSRDFYTLVLIDEDIKEFNNIDKIRKRLNDSNIGVLSLDSKTDTSHPALIAARKANILLPARILLAPDGRILLLEEEDVEKVVDLILSSPLRLRLLDNLYSNFAFTLWIESSDPTKNSQIEAILEKACNEITNRIPNMPKQVRNGAGVIKISYSDIKNEKILLWALGIDKIPESPIAFVIYGRGRIMGEGLEYKEIMDNRAFQYMAMIGADCECGLDRKWMLGDQIPLNWPEGSRQELTNELGFDVDNPMILAEMSHILSKDPNNGKKREITFAPEEIDLEKFFSESGNKTLDESSENKKRYSNPLFIILMASVIILIAGSGIFFLRNKRN